MIDALITGRLAADPKHGTSKNGSPYATARVLATVNTENLCAAIARALKFGRGHDRQPG